MHAIFVCFSDLCRFDIYLIYFSFTFFFLNTNVRIVKVRLLTLKFVYKYLKNSTQNGNNLNFMCARCALNASRLYGIVRIF